MTFSPETTVGELAARFPATTQVFERYGVEFCCGGGHALEQVCREHHLSYDELAAALVAAVMRSAARGGWAARPVSDLTEHIAETFHRTFRQELPRLLDAAARLQGHGDSHRRALGVVHYELGRLNADLDAQMRAEEHDLFPLLDGFERDGVRPGGWALFAYHRARMRASHGDAVQTLRILRQITDGYVPPQTACPALRALYRSLGELEALMQLHVHLETNVLIPRAEAMAPDVRLESF
jgi:regulator of cell morphogenesis and NO signaling